MANEDLREIYGLLRDIKADIASIKTENRIDHESLVAVETRIDKVESILDRAMGAKAIICLVASAIGAVIVAGLQWLFSKGGELMATVEEVVRMLNLMLVYGLRGYDFCAQFPNSVLAEDFNGIGPEWMPAKLRAALDRLHADFLPCAFCHDVRYAHSDGSHEQFVAANEEFLDNCIIVANAKYAWYDPRRYIRRRQGRALFRAVVMFGWPAYQAAFLKREGVNTISVG